MSIRKTVKKLARRAETFAKSMTLAWIAAVGAAVCMAAAALWWGGLNQDEGWYLYAAQMVKDGALPYRDFFFTQGPTMPFVYAVLSPVWRAAESPLHGLLGGRAVTLAFGLAGALLAAALARRLVPRDSRPLAGLVAFALLACNIYHVYFTTIPKTYALGGLFVLAGFLLLANGLTAREEADAAEDGAADRAGRVAGAGRVLLLAASGAALAFAAGTRISLVLILPAVGIPLLIAFPVFGWAFLWFGLGGAAGLFLTYGLFALDPASLRGLLAAQSYHAARGGFDPFFVIGSVARLMRGHAALFVLIPAALFLRRRSKAHLSADAAAHIVLWTMGLGFAAVLLLQLSAPFPYDDYQTPIMPLLAVIVAAFTARSRGHGAEVHARAARFVVALVCLASFTSPLLQEWATDGQDRFWSMKKERTELAKLRDMAREIECLDPGGRTLLTQDLYLAIETGRAVPRGFEMGPFCYFPDLSDEAAEALNVMNRPRMEATLAAAPCSVAACSGYAFAIGAPSCRETPYGEQTRFFEILKRGYEFVDREPKFGQNATTLLILKRREAPGS